MRLFRLTVALLVFLAASPVRAQEPSSGPRVAGLAIDVITGYTLPLPPHGEPYVSGLTADLRLSYRLPFLSRVVLFAQMNYSQQWIDLSMPGLFQSLFTITADGGLGYSFLDPAGFHLTPYGFAGWGWGSLANSFNYNVVQPVFGGGLAAEFRLNDRFAFYGDLAYRWFRNTLSFGRLAAGIRFAPTFVPLRKPGEMYEIQYRRVFPAFYKYYETHPIASASFVNMGEQPITDLRVTFFVDDYMSSPHPCVAPERVEPKQSVPIDVYALFSPAVLGVSEGATVQGVFKIDYSAGGRQISEQLVESVYIEDRNAMTWDDDERAAAFVTALDQTVLAVAKNAVSAVDQVAGPAFDPDLLRAIVMYHALGLYGISYVPDPNTPHTEFAVTEGAVDFLQFPRQTLLYGAGDCDDLSILYCALLESIGTSTAFITIPGHIFAAVRIGLSSDQWRQIEGDPADLIHRDGTTWLPVEVTLLRQGFNAAWRAGAEQWREYDATGEAQLLTLQESWETYEPVGFSSDLAQLALPDTGLLRGLTSDDVTRLVMIQIREEESRLLSRLDRDPADSALLNRLGVLYARHSLAEQAAEQLSKAAETGYLPALVNLGNLRFVQGDSEGALGYYEQALSIDPGSAAALLGAARCFYGRGDYNEAAASYQLLAEIEPDLAGEYDYVARGASSTARAASVDQQRSVPWVE